MRVQRDRQLLHRPTSQYPDAALGRSSAQRRECRGSGYIIRPCDSSVGSAPAWREEVRRLASSFIAALLAAGCVQAQAASCLEQLTGDIRTATPNSAGEIRISPKAGETYDLTGISLRSNAPKYPLVLRDAGDNSCVTGAKIQGQQSRSLTWLQMKKSYDGDAANFKYPRGRVTFENLWIDNVQDGLSIPTQNQPKSVYWTARTIYARYIRDDFIENDTCMPGEINDVLVDGAFMFLSSRPGEESTVGTGLQPVIKIRNSLVRLQCLPNLSSDNSCDGVTSTGHLFKQGSCSGTVDVENVIFRVDSHNSAGDSTMRFAPGRYSNVTLLWLGKGDYPARVPSGVTVSRDTTVWDRARASWLTRHGCSSDGNVCPFVQRR
jgi:hypothetical protein